MTGEGLLLMRKEIGVKISTCTHEDEQMIGTKLRAGVRIYEEGMDGNQGFKL